MKYSDQELLDALRRLADDLDREPTQTDMESRGPYSVQPYYDHFGSWQDAKERAGVTEPESNGKQVTDEELLAELRRLERELSRVPTIRDMRAEGRHSVTTYYDRFGTWRAAQEAAGMDSNDPMRKADDEELLAEIQRLADELGHAPSFLEMNEQGAYWVSTYRDHFGSWAEALRQAGFEASSRGRKIPAENLREEIRRVSDVVDGEPTLTDMEQHGEYGSTTYIRRFGSWTDVRDRVLKS